MFRTSYFIPIKFIPMPEKSQWSSLDNDKKNSSFCVCECESLKIQFISADGINRKSIADAEWECRKSVITIQLK